MSKECTGGCYWDWPDDCYCNPSQDVPCTHGPAWPDGYADPKCDLHGINANTILVTDGTGATIHIESYDARCLCGHCHAAAVISS